MRVPPCRRSRVMLSSQRLWPWLWSILVAFITSPVPFVRGLVPEANHRLRQVMLVPHRAEAGRAQQEIPACSRREPEPAGGEHPEKVSARKEQRVPFEGSHAPHH